MKGRTEKRRAARAAACLGLVCGAALLAGCASRPPPVAATSPEPDTELTRSLVELADAALAEGDLRAAEGRLRRALSLQPSSSAVRTGLGRVALRRGNPALARGWLEAVVAADPDAVAARVELAGIEAKGGDRARASHLLAEATACDPADPVAHDAYQRLSGTAPRTPPPGDAGAARRLAEAHPYDLWPAVAWAELALRTPLDTSLHTPLDTPVRTLRRTGEGAELERALDALAARLWLADLDRASAERALRLLARHRDAWRERRVVWVHVFADETVTRHPGWEMRLRGLWRGQSEAFAPLVDTVFLPATLSTFSAAAAGARLASIELAWRGSATRWPPAGILAAFTERPGPKLASGYKLGLAELLGRRLIVRLSPGETDSRTLAHEVLHLYGAVHVRDEVESLMNPSGDSLVLDAANARIARLLRGRTFRGGGFARDAFPFVDAAELTDAYTDLLRTNLAFRALGLERALEAASTSRYHASRLARREIGQDDHFGDVASFVGSLLLYQGRLVDAAFFFDGAARLYGPASSRGVAARARFDEIYRVLQARGDVD